MSDVNGMTTRPVSIVGTCHGDPLCRRDAKSWISAATVARGAPSFIAVEASDELLRALQRERESLCHFASRQWPLAHPEFIGEFGRALSFEADVHREIVDVEPLWLDRGRKSFTHIEEDGSVRTSTPEQEVDGLGLSSFRDYWKWLDDEDIDPELDPSAALAEVSRRVQVLCASGADETTAAARLAVVEEWNAHSRCSRDEIWTERIMEKVRDAGLSWGLLVVGVRHSQPHDGSVRMRLEASGVDVEVIRFAA